MLRKGFCLLLLLVLPITVYWPTVFHEYGFRDDYAHLREVREEPGKLFGFTASNGRPIYGAVLEASLHDVVEVADLPMLRLVGALLLTAVGVAVWWLLHRAGWSALEATVVSIGVSMLPASQIAVGWAIAWPIVLAMLCALGGFAAVETQMTVPGWRRVAGFAVAVLLYFVAGLTYQSSAMFIVVPLAGLLLARSDDARVGHVRWLATHLATLLLGLLAAFVLMKALFALGVFAESDRMASFEADPLGKLLWFVQQPLANALGLFALRDRFGTGAAWFWGAAAVVVAVIAGGFFAAAPRRTRSERARWLVCLLFLPFVAHAVSLAAEERNIGYRTIFALGGLVIVLFVYSLRGLLGEIGGGWRIAHRFALAAFVVLAALAANYNAFTLIAEPQSREWAMVDDTVERMRLDDDPTVYIIEPTVGDRSTERMFADEFGSLSADSDWVPREMFKAALRERFRGKIPAAAKYTLKFGHELPMAAYDVVIDMRRLRQLRGPFPTTAAVAPRHAG